MMDRQITGLVIAWNEEKNLEACLNSIRQVTNTLVVGIDEATTDSSASIAKKFGAKVYYHPHSGVVESIRQSAIKNVNTPWVVMLDADERISPELAKEIRNVPFSTTSDSAFSIPRLNYFFHQPVWHSNWEPEADRQIRLFKANSITWPNVIHASPAIIGTTGSLKHLLHHNNYSTVSEFILRMNRYTSKETISINPLIDIYRRFIHHAGFKDGILGLFLAYLMGIYHVSTQIKLWEKEIQ